MELKNNSLKRLMKMVLMKGFNSDICFKGCSYHIQTEDWGELKSSIVTKVFKNGAVVKTVTSSYRDFISTGNNSSIDNNSDKLSCIQMAMQSQHRTVLTLLHSGQLFP